MSTEQYWNDIDRETAKVLGRKARPSTIFPTVEGGWHLTVCTTAQENDRHDRNIQGEIQYK
jgi:hypothetical protein